MSSIEQASDRSERLAAILAMLAESERLSVAEAAASLNVSDATVRRDFGVLAEQQLVTRTHGGVVATPVAYGLPVRYRERSTAAAKDRIATAVADLVEPGTAVAFNGGTTTTACARKLAARPDLAESGPPAVTVVTNALNIASELVLRPHIRTVLLGGVALPRSYELTGPLAVKALGEVWLDVAVLGVGGLAADADASCADEAEAEVSALMTHRANRVVVAADAAKIGRRTFARICSATDVDVLVTDEAADSGQLTALREAGVSVLVA